MRPKAFAPLIVILLLAGLAVAGGELANAQKRTAQANVNTAQSSKKSDRQKRVFVGRGTDTAQGSRVSIKSDDTLKDYSAYRSGDRFYVVLPKTAASAVSKGANGKGYSDMQVQQRGSDVVVSYRVQPGAKPRVEQKFNRLDVVFDVPAGSQSSAPANDSASRTNSQPASQPPAQSANTSTTNQTANQQTQSQATQNAPSSEKRPTQQAEAASKQGTVATTSPIVATGQPDGAGQQQPAPNGAQTPPAASLTPVPATPSEQQIASANPPGTIAPITTANPSTSAPSSGSTLGTYLLQNWWVALVLALAVIGLGLVVAARRSSGTSPDTLEESKTATTTTLKEPRAARLKDASKKASISATESISAASTTTSTATDNKKTDALKDNKKADALKTAVAASTVTVKESKNARKKLKKKAGKGAKNKSAWAEELAAVETPTVEAAAIAETPVVEPVAPETIEVETVVTDSHATELAAQPAATELVTEPAETELVIESATTELVTEPVASDTVAVDEPTVIDEPVVVEETDVAAMPVVVEPVSEELAAPESSVAEIPFEEVSLEPFEKASPEETDVEEVAVEETSVEAVAETSVEAVAVENASTAVEVVEDTTVEVPEEVEATKEVEPASFATTEIAPAAPVSIPAVIETAPAVTGIAPLDALDPDNVQAEARRVLQGEAYDEAVIGSSDSMARQMISAELLSALSGRNPERRARARAAFIKHGYFDQKLHDVTDAEASAERSAAARSLALVGDLAATPQLVSALEDNSVDVRRAAVEALCELRDPAAVAPLESLQERERKQRDKIPPRIIRNAIETCRVAAEQMRVESQSAHAEPVINVEPVQVEAPALHAESPVLEEAFNESPSNDDPIAVPVSREEYESISAKLNPFEIGYSKEAESLQTSVEETTVEIEPVEAIELESVLVEESTAISAIEAVPEATGETHYVEIESHHYAAQDVLEPSVEVPEEVTQQHVVEESGIQPFEEADNASIHVFEPSLLEPSPQEFEAPTNSVESRQVTLFDEDVTIASGVSEIEESSAIVPVGSSDDWVELDVYETRFGEQTTALEPSAQSEPHAQVFEPSADEEITRPFKPSVKIVPSVAEEPRVTAIAEKGIEESFAPKQVVEPAKPAPDSKEKGIALFDENSTVPASIQQKLGSRLAGDRAAAITELSQVDSDEAFQQICAAFEDESKDVRAAAARALYDLRTDRAESFTRALREATPERRRLIGSAISTSGLASESISQLTGESREKTYEAFSLLFLMAKAGEVQPLIRAIEGHPNNEVRLAVVKLLALSGQKEILPAFRRLAVRGSLPTEVRAAVMEAIYQISSSQPSAA